MAFNKVILLGNLTADPETRTTPSGQSVTSFSLAVNRTWNDANGQRQEETSFINCTAWGQRGETIAKYVQKGRQLLVSGRLQQRSWDDKDTGKNAALSTSSSKSSVLSATVGAAVAIALRQPTHRDHRAPAKLPRHPLMTSTAHQLT